MLKLCDEGKIYGKAFTINLGVTTVSLTDKNDAQNLVTIC
jgi:hypothetical protein